MNDSRHNCAHEPTLEEGNLWLDFCSSGDYLGEKFFLAITNKRGEGGLDDLGNAERAKYGTRNFIRHAWSVCP